MSYQSMDHARWVESNNRASNQMYARRKSHRPLPESLTPFQARVMDILGMVGGGIYNAPIAWDKVEWSCGRGVAVPYADRHFSTFDFSALTQLVFLCHEARIRCELRNHTRGYFMLFFHERVADGDMAQRHPNLEEAVAAFRKYLPADHRIIYAPASAMSASGQDAEERLEAKPASAVGAAETPQPIQSPPLSQGDE